MKIKSIKKVTQLDTLITFDTGKSESGSLVQNEQLHIFIFLRALV